MQTKVCSRCKEEKPVSEFSKHKNGKYGVNGQCKICVRQKRTARYYANIEYYKAKNKEYKERRKEKIKAYVEANRERQREATARWYQNNKERHAANGRKWRQANRDRLSAWMREKRKSSAVHRMSGSVSLGIWKSLKGCDIGKSNRPWEGMVGYTCDDLKKHIESLFCEGMSWGNYGRGGWHIDHIVPLSMFVFDSAEHPNFKKAWALSNLQPLWGRDNLRKHKKLYWAQEGTLDL